MTVSIGVAGLGYWGPNLARNFARLEDCELRWCCDASDAVRERLAPSFPGTRFTGELDDLLADETLDAVVLATPVPTHAALAERVLDAGKHCFVEKPLAQSVADAERVVAAGERAGRILMVGHLLEYHPGVAKLKEIATSGELGEIHYIYSNRLNLGKLRADENALWEHFVECIRTGATPVSDGASGLRVVRVLEGLQNRLDANRGLHDATV